MKTCDIEPRLAAGRRANRFIKYDRTHPVSGRMNRPSREADYRGIWVADGMLREWVNTGFPLSSQKIAEMMYFLSRQINP